MSDTQAVDLSAERLPDGGVRLYFGGQPCDLTEEEWVNLMADMCAVGRNEGSVATAGMFHKGRVSVEVQVDQQAIGRVMLKQAGGIALPEIVKPVERGVLALPRR